MSMNRKMNWLPDMDLNHDKQIQSLLCYRYTIGQTSGIKVECSTVESRFVQVPKPETRADLRKERGRLVRGLQAPFSKRHADEASALLISLFLNRPSVLVFIRQEFFQLEI